MQIQFTINIDQDREDRLVKAIGCTKTALSAELNVYAKAALSEYVDMFSGITAPRTIGEMREQRLLQIIIADSRQLPTDRMVSQLFHVTRAQARTLLRAVFEKREFETGERLRQVCIDVVKNADKSVDPFTLTINDLRVYEALDRVLYERGDVPLLQRTDSAAKYGAHKNSLKALQKHFGLPN
jgi:hypothetical protein